MVWSRIVLPDGDPLPDAFHSGHALVIRDGDRLSLLCSHELFDLGESPRAELEDLLVAGAGGGIPVHRADLRDFEEAGDVLACGEGLEIRIVPDALVETLIEPISIGRSAMGRVGGSRAEGLTLLVDRSLEPRPAMRRLRSLPSERCGGLMPFFTAVGAEPQVLLDEIEGLIAELDRRGPEWVAIIARAGAFLWHLDLRGREGRDRHAALRIDEDVVLPLTGGLDPLNHLKVGGDLGDLILSARRGDFDLAFVCAPTPRATLDELEASSAFPAFMLAPELPGSLMIL